MHIINIHRAVHTPVLLSCNNYSSARFGCSAGSYRLVMEACCHYWNTCLPLVTSSRERALLCEPLLELLTLVSTFVRRRTESYDKPVVHLCSAGEDHNLLVAMYGLVFQVYADKVLYSISCMCFLMVESLLLNFSTTGRKVYRLLKKPCGLCLKQLASN